MYVKKIGAICVRSNYVNLPFLISCMSLRIINLSCVEYGNITLQWHMNMTYMGILGVFYSAVRV